MRIAVPEANPALSIGAALGITFPFNLVVGHPDLLIGWPASLQEYSDEPAMSRCAATS